MLASGVVDGEEREYTLLPVLMQPTLNAYTGDPGSAGLDWVPIGFELCSRPCGKRFWQSDGFPKSPSVKEAMLTLADRLEIPDDALIHPWVIEARRERRALDESG